MGITGADKSEELLTASRLSHAVYPKWLHGYVNEYVWRCNHRDDSREMFSALLLRSAFPVFGH